MFKKLKEKITEEVKISPQRFVEFTQSVSDRLQNSSTSDDNFFSIGDDDTNTSIDSNNYGFSSVQLMSPSQERLRKNSTSSLASDVSFLPRYEPGSMYHLQSDLEVSASEVEDNVSTSSSQLGHLTKEQIYSAFQKSQMRYHKYRGRYTDLTRHYKDLERENSKMKSVLVETQDKAIRRVTELKEQCSLEQKAKAHLEGALRDEIDERNYKIKSLQTKVDLLQNESTSNSLISTEDNGNSSENLDNLTKYLNDSRKEIEVLNSKMQELKANSIVFQSKEQEYKLKISNLEKEIANFSEREKENNLNLAQNKMDLHNEILLKDNDISNLKRDNETLKQKLELLEIENKSNSNQKLENLQSQNKKLIEKVESLTQKNNNYENELLKMETHKLEIKNMKEKTEEMVMKLTQLQKLKEKLMKENSELNDTLLKDKEDYERQIFQLREDAKKGLISLEPKIREKLQNEFAATEEELRKDFASKFDELTSSNTSTKDLQIQLLEKENLIKKIDEELKNTKTELANKVNAHNDLEKNHLELIENCTDLRNTISNFEKDRILLEAQEEKISRLESHIKTLREELRTSEEASNKTIKELRNLKEALKNSNEEISILEEKNKTMELQSSDNNLLLSRFEEEKHCLLKQWESDKTELYKIIEDRNKEIADLNVKLEKEKLKSIALNEERTNFQKNILELQQKIRLLEEKGITNEMVKNEASLMDLKLEQLEEMNAKNLEEFEKEREFILEDLAFLWKELNLKEEEENYETFIKAGINLRLNILRKMCKKKNELYDHLRTEYSLKELDDKVKSDELKRLGNEMSNVQAANQNFEANIQHLQNDLAANKVLLQERDNLLDTLKLQSLENKKKTAELESLLSKERTSATSLFDENSELNKTIKDLKEKYLLLEKKLEIFEMTQSECGMLELKLQKMEIENENLTQLLDEKRSYAENTSKELLESTRIIQELEARKLVLEDKFNDKQNILKDLNEQINRITSEVNKEREEREFVLGELKEARRATEELEKKNEEKDREISKLSETITYLKSSIEKQTAAFKSLEKENSEAINKENDNQSEFKLQINELRSQVEHKTAELDDVNIKVSELEDRLQTKLEFIRTLKEERDAVVEEVNNLKKDISHERGKIKEEMEELNIRVQQISSDNRNLTDENQSLSQEKEELKISMEMLKEQRGSELDRESFKKETLSLKNTVEDLKVQLNNLKTENERLIDESNSANTNGSNIAKIQEDFFEIKQKCDGLFVENKNLRQEYDVLKDKCNSFGKIKQKFEGQIKELESQYNELLREKQLLEDEVQELKTSPINYRNDNSKLNNLDVLKNEQNVLNDSEKQIYVRELDLLREKLIKYKSLDLTNKSSIEFYENELQKMKNQNDKLTRKLDETLVTLNHCAELSTSTEVEYLRNVLFNYMLGKESVVLARVIAAVCKFDPQQTEMILQKEQQKQTLLGQLGLI